MVLALGSERHGLVLIAICPLSVRFSTNCVKQLPFVPSKVLSFAVLEVDDVRAHDAARDSLQPFS